MWRTRCKSLKHSDSATLNPNSGQTKITNPQRQYYLGTHYKERYLLGKKFMINLEDKLINNFKTYGKKKTWRLKNGMLHLVKKRHFRKINNIEIPIPLTLEFPKLPKNSNQTLFPTPQSNTVIHPPPLCSPPPPPPHHPDFSNSPIFTKQFHCSCKLLTIY